MTLIWQQIKLNKCLFFALSVKAINYTDWNKCVWKCVYVCVCACVCVCESACTCMCVFVFLPWELVVRKISNKRFVITFTFLQSKKKYPRQLSKHHLTVKVNEMFFNKSDFNHFLIINSMLRIVTIMLKLFCFTMLNLNK